MGRSVRGAGRWAVVSFLGALVGAGACLAACGDDDDDSSGGGAPIGGAAGRAAQGAAGAAGGGAGGASGAGGDGGAGGGEPAPSGWHVDTSYGEKGLAQLAALDPFADGFTFELQPDGKVLAVGGKHGAVVRVLPDGTLDPSFGTGGVAAHGPESLRSLAVAVQADGRVVISGIDEANELVAPFWRLLPNGALDPSFGQGGRADVGLLGNENRGVIDLETLPDGRVVGVGSVWQGVGCGAAVLAVRLTAAGEPDPSFGQGAGFVAPSSVGPTPCTDHLAAHVRANADGSLDIIGDGENQRRESGDTDTFWARLTPEGLPDLSFDQAGFRFFDATLVPVGGRNGNYTHDVARAEGGGFFVAGRLNNGQTDWVVMKLTAEAALDPSFGQGGLVHYDAGPTATGEVGLEQAWSIAALPGGDVLVTGQRYVTAHTSPTYLYAGMARRLRADGSADPGFGEGGVLTVDLGVDETRVVATAALPEGGVLLGVSTVTAIIDRRPVVGLVRILPPPADAPPPK